MQTPSVALAWELWRRNRLRLIGMLAMLLGFALIYPKLCAQAGVDLSNSEDMVSFTGKFMKDDHTNHLIIMIQLLYLLFLAGGPVLAMFLSLLCLTWMFTFVEFHPNAKNPVRFPERLFTLPLSTSFLFTLLFGGGVAALALLFGCWHLFVTLPRALHFGEYEKCFGWLTLLALAQGITWALARWPNTRLCALMALLFGFLFSPAWEGFLDLPIVLPTLFVLGAVLARLGLEKMRHGQWQGWTWPKPLQTRMARVPLRGPKHFASPAQAQLWFEWRRFARPISMALATFALVPVFLHFVVRRVFGLGPLDDNTLGVFAFLLAVMPPAIYFCMSSVPPLKGQSFSMLRPLTNGQMVMATLKAATLSVAFSWLMVIAAFCALSLLGDLESVERHFALPSTGQRAAVVLCLVVLTWRNVPAELCFVLDGRRWMGHVPWLKLFATWVVVFLYSETEQGFMQVMPMVLAFLLALKLLLACVSFRVSLQRRLIAPSAVLNYLGLWAFLVAAWLALIVVLFHPDAHLFLPLSLAVILLVPLARVGFAPIALAQSRHA